MNTSRPDSASVLASPAAKTAASSATTARRTRRLREEIRSARSQPQTPAASARDTSAQAIHGASDVPTSSPPMNTAPTAASADWIVRSRQAMSTGLGIRCFRSTGRSSAPRPREGNIPATGL
ncbi:hypothetical protein [Nonomuraea sp. NPDC003804]|uniref:hypothetical protein n=1 Tax=Nonomuraea sp. NPDC003804 TaxID=3154547 RepID=UPI0033A6C3DA